MAKLLKLTAKRKIIIDTLLNTFSSGGIQTLPDSFLTTVPCDVLHNLLTDPQKEEVVDRIFNYYRKIGFPYYETDDVIVLKEHRKFMNFDTNTLVLPNNELNQAMLGLSITNAFFPNMWSVKCKKQKTPMDVFSDDTLFKEAIRRRIKMSDTKLAPFNIRKSIRLFSGAQSVSGFRPTIAKCLIDILFPNGNNLSVLDPCMGWGGRMYGFVCSNKVKEYTGFDVSTEAINGLNNLKDKLIKLEIDNNTKINIHQHPFEDAGNILKTYDKFDLVMTSPPYFDIEKYSTDADQSYNKFNTYDKWLAGFLRPSIQLSYDNLKTDGYIAFNVGYGKLYDDTHKIIGEIFGKVDAVYKMRLSRLCGRGIDKSVEKFKYEPIIIAKKLEK